MLLYEKPDPFVVRAERFPKPFKRFGEQHLAGSAHQIIRIGNELFLRCKRHIFLARKPKPDGLVRGNARPDVAFNDQRDPVGKTEALRNFNARHRMSNAMGPGPANIMEQPPEADQLPVHRFLYPFRKGDRQLRNLLAVSNNTRGTTGLYQHFNVTHKSGDNTTIL